MEEIHPILLLAAHNTGELVEADPETAGPFNMGVFNDMVGKEPFPANTMGEEKTSSSSQESSNAAILPEACNRQTDFFEPDDISIHSLSVTFTPFYCGTKKIQILHENCPLQLWCKSLKVRFGISTKFVDHAGRPRLNIVVNALPSQCKILDESDGLAQKLSMDSGSLSEWRPVVTRKAGFFNCPTVQFHLPTVTDGDIVRCRTEIYQKDASSMQRLVFCSFDIAELHSLFNSWDSVGCLRLTTECWHPIDSRKVDCSFRLMD